MRTKSLRAIGALLLASTALTLARPAQAQDATWVGGDASDPTAWLNDNNWNPAGIPSGTATFGVSGVTSVVSDGLVNLGAVTFLASAPSYSVTVNDFFIQTGVGAANNSLAVQEFKVIATMLFLNSSSASAGTNIVTYTNSGSIIFSNTSTAGNALISNNGVVEFNDTSRAGTSAIVNNATVNFQDSSSAGNAQIVNLNNGTTLTFNSNATGGNALITNRGTLTFNNSASADHANITNENGATLSFNHTSKAGLSTIDNSGSLSFNDSASADNALITNNSGASLAFKNSSTAGSVNISNLTGGTVDFLDTSTAGNAHINNNATVTFQASSTAGTSTIGNTATLLFMGGSTAGNASITNNTTGVLSFWNTSTAGNATIINDGASISFLDSSTAGNATITNKNFGVIGFAAGTSGGNAMINNNGGSVTFGGTAGNAIITNGSGGRVNFNGSGTGGAAQLINNAGGIVDFSNSTAVLTAGSIEGAGQFNLGARQVTVGGNNRDSTVSGVINDCGSGLNFCITAGTGGSLVKTGSGTLTLSGNNTYTGATTVNAGTLQVDGTIEASSGVTVNSGGALTGSGFVSATTVNDGGAIMAGSFGTPATLTVQGSLALSSAAMYVVQISPSSAGKVAVNGTATLGGTALATFAGGSSAAGATYTILSATGGVSGTFAGLNTLGLAPSLRAKLSYDADDVFLTLAYATISPSLLPGANANQRAVATAVDAAIAGGGTPLGSFNTLLGLQGNALGAALTQASGETATGAQQTTFNAMNLFMGALTDPFSAGRGGAAAPGASPFADESANAYASTKKPSAARDALAMVTKAPLAQTYDPRWSVWASGFGGTQTTDGNAAVGSNTATSRIFGTAVGFDYRFSPNTIAGVALGGGGTSFSVANGGNGRSDLFQAGAFVRHTVGPTYITAALAYGWQDVTTDRTVTIAGADRLQARFSANTFAGRVEGGYRFVAPWIGGLGLTPYAAGQFTTVDLPDYAESVISGSNAFALNYGSKSVTNTRSELGLRADKSFALTDAILTLRGRAAWAHDFDPGRSIAATFQTLPGASFVVNGAAMARDSALTTASAEVKWLNGVSVAATFEGEFSDVTRSYAGKGTVRYAW